MSTAGVVSTGGTKSGATPARRQTFRGMGRLAARPTLGVELGVGVTWLVLLVGLAGESAGSPTSPSRALWWCTASMAGMARTVGGGSTSSLGAFAAGIGMWAAMATAMMLPSAMPAVRHVAVNSLYRRRRRAVIEFLAVYLGVWIGFGVAVLAVLAVWRPAEAVALPAALLVAVLWQLTPGKRRALRNCHRSCALPPFGWRASAGVARFGLRNGGACVASCWALMLTMALVSSGRLLWMAVLTGVVLGEKLTLKPRRATRRSAVVLGAAAAGAGVAALVG
ncbi:MAG TPA: DUF2182 domain-containing protein [Solirubrobacteraceae bacterium]|nr:DUF2182 domain-containing protein [Solirubrobacteraceae bacterium]